MISVDLKSLFRRLNRFTTRALEGAAGMAVERAHQELTIEHTLLRLIDEPKGDIRLILDGLGADVPALNRSLTRSLDNMRGGSARRPVPAPTLVELIQDAWAIASIERGLDKIRSGLLLQALVGRTSRFLVDAHPEIDKLKADLLREKFLDLTAGSEEEAEIVAAAGGAPGAAPAAGIPTGGALATYATNLTADARNGRIDPVLGRDKEIRQMIDILARRRKNNPILVGEAGVGKTAVVEGLALRIALGDVPDLIKNAEIYGIDLGMLQAGASVKGEFERRLKAVIDEVKASAKPIILFIDEAHTLIGAGGAAGTGDAANLLKPALARGELRTIGATTWAEFKKYFEEDPALTRRFQPVKVDEPSPELAAEMLRGIKDKYEKAHKVTVRADAILAASRLSARYIAGRQLPDKAVDLLDTAAARVKISRTGKPGPVEDLERRIQDLEREQVDLIRDRDGGGTIDEERLTAVGAEIETGKTRLAQLQEAHAKELAAIKEIDDLRAKGAELSPEEKTLLDEKLTALRELQKDSTLVELEVDPDTVAQVIGDWTGIPVGSMVRDEAQVILNLEQRLGERIKGQNHATSAVAKVVRGAKAGLRDPDKPIGVFLLVGPSGVGKTETGLAIADLLFGGEKFLVSINMSEYQDREMGVSGLVGAKPGYVGYGKGGTLTEAVRQRPYAVVLLDEIEKACQEVRNLFYQVFDKGTLTDGTGREIDFKNTVIFITSNLCSHEIQSLTQQGVTDPEQIVEQIRPLLSRSLQPAWLARCTVVPFFSLPPEALRDITVLKLQKVSRRLKESQKIDLTFSAAVIDQVVQRCTEVETGARNIDFILQQSLLPLVSQEILTRMATGALPDALSVGLDEEGNFHLE